LFATGLTQGQITANAQQVFKNLRDALECCQDLYAWLSAQSTDDLEGLGYAAADVATLQAAAADANAVASLYNGVALPSSYTLPYDFGASQRQVIGPQ
jgi:hypothetical protein